MFSPSGLLTTSPQSACEQRKNNHQLHHDPVVVVEIVAGVFDVLLMWFAPVSVLVPVTVVAGVGVLTAVTVAVHHVIVVWCLVCWSVLC